MRVAVTGHRPEDLVGVESWVQTQLGVVFASLNPDRVYVGMAAGVDLWAGMVALQAGFPVVACKPWAGHTPRVADRVVYNTVWGSAVEQVNVHPDQVFPGVWAYHDRNHYMVDNADVVVAVLKSGKKSGGTFQCVKYAKQVKKSLIIIDPATRNVNMGGFENGLF